MVRSILAVIVGYLVMFLCIFASFSTAYLLMGTERAFRPESYEVSAFWLALSFPLSLVAAIAGGFVCAKIARGGKAPIALAVLVFVLGILSAIPVLTATADRGKIRSAEVGNLAAMAEARQPTWVALANPIVGVVGTLLGAKLASRRGVKSPRPSVV